MVSFENFRMGIHRTAAADGPEGFKATVLFQALEEAMNEDKDNLVAKFRGIYGFKVKNGPGGKEGYWVINGKSGKGTIEFNSKSNIYLHLMNVK
jgi:sterol carrier protein 2